MYKYANTKKTEMSRLGDVSGNAETETDVVDARRCTENCKNEIDVMYTYKTKKKTSRNENENTKKKNRGIGKTERTCENEKKNKTKKSHTERHTICTKKNADGDDADERDGNRCVGWRSIRNAGNCDARRTSERRYGEYRARQEADARLQ